MRRSITVLAAGLVGLVAISPVIASADAPGRGSSPAAMEPTSSSTSPTTAAPYQAPTTSSSSPAPPAPPAPYQSPTTSSSSPAPYQSPTTSSTAPPSGDAAPPADNCVPATDRSPAPTEGTSEVFEAGEAGSVEVKRVSATDLAIGEVTPNDGWTHQITGASGPRVKVRFDHPSASPSRIRFAANMDDAGEEIHIRVTSCE